jgi:hypothetical protein
MTKEVGFIGRVGVKFKDIPLLDFGLTGPFFIKRVFFFTKDAFAAVFPFGAQRLVAAVPPFAFPLRTRVV